MNCDDWHQIAIILFVINLEGRKWESGYWAPSHLFDAGKRLALIQLLKVGTFSPV